MGFRIKFSRRLFAVVLMIGGLGWTQDYGSSRLTVFVNDSVGVKHSVLRHAETEAARLFHPAGIEIEWRNCADTSDCRRPPRSNEFVLHIVAQGTARSDFVFGEAFLGPDGKGKYADVFFNRLRQEEKNIDVAQLLGAVTAHELGHLFLGSHSHSLTGIMEPLWGPEILSRISMGNLTFLPEQERSIGRRLRGETLAATSLGEAAGLGLQ
ncbi:MAG TPA: hypothetical protein VMG82_34525 [Candidatus Sulfotelmatobacter sp.]|nr:hypothetical protein [Candidatus Sulfotelmatobacter sp.]